MKRVTFFLLSSLMLLCNLQIKAQWLVGGNNLASNGNFGSNTNFSVLFETNNLNRGILTNAGLWGFGTTAPERRVHVFNASAGAVISHPNAALVVENSSHNYINILAPDAFETGILFGKPASNVSGGVIYNNPSTPNGLQFRTNGNFTRMSITNIGNVGIGTTAPERKLHVFNGSAGVVTSNANAPLVVENSANSFINVLAPAASEKGILFGDPGNAQNGGVIYVGSNNSLHFRTNGNVTRMTLSSAGNLDLTGGTLSFGSVETLADAGAFTISSNSNFVPSTDNSRDLGSSTLRWNEVFAATGFVNSSDAREKTNIKDLDYGLKEVMKLRSVRFNWKNDEAGGEKIGLLAQDLQKVLPEVVRDWEYKVNEETGVREKVPAVRLGVRYLDIIPVLIRSIQEQQGVIDAKDQQLSDLQSQVNQLQSQFQQLNSLLIKMGVVTGGALSGINKAYLQSSSPNPFSNISIIRYYVPEDAAHAVLQIIAANGAVVKSLQISQKGFGQLQLDGKELAAGVYTSTLFVGGEKMDSKKLVIVR